MVGQLTNKALMIPDEVRGATAARDWGGSQQNQCHSGVPSPGLWSTGRRRKEQVIEVDLRFNSVKPSLFLVFGCRTAGQKRWLRDFRITRTGIGCQCDKTNES